MNILITGVHGPAGEALLAQFAETRHSNHRIIGVDTEPVDHPALHAAEQVPAASEADMIDRLSDLVRRHDVDVIIPTVQEELPVLARAARECRFYPARVVVPEPADVEVSCDRYRTMLLLEESWVPIPRFTRPEFHQDPATMVEAVGDHAVIQPRECRGPRRVREIHPGLMAESEWADVGENVLLQEFAPGQEFAPMVYLPPGDKPPTVVVVEKLRGGDAGAQEVQRLPADEHPEVGRIALGAARALGLRGPVDVSLRCLADGRPVVLSVNARFGAHSALAPEILDALLEDLTADLEPGLSPDLGCR